MKISIVVLSLILAVLQWRLWAGDGSIAEVVRLNAAIDTQREENTRIASANARIAMEVAALKNGTDAIEARARQQMGMIKEGETFILLVEPQ